MSTNLADWVPVPTVSFSRVHKAFVGCLTSFAQAFVSNCESQRSIDKYCTLPPIPRLSLRSRMSRSASSSGLFDGSSFTRRRCWFAVRQSHAVQHYSQVFWVAHVCNTRSRLRCSPKIPDRVVVDTHRDTAQRVTVSQNEQSGQLLSLSLPLPCSRVRCRNAVWTHRFPCKLSDRLRENFVLGAPFLSLMPSLAYNQYPSRQLPEMFPDRHRLYHLRLGLRDFITAKSIAMGLSSRSNGRV